MQDATRFPLLPFVRQAAFSKFLPDLGATSDAIVNEAWLHPARGLTKIGSKASLCANVQKTRRDVDRYLPALANTVVHCDRAWRCSLVQSLARYLIARGSRMIDYDIFTGSDETPMKIAIKYRPMLMETIAAPMITDDAAAAGETRVATQSEYFETKSTAKRTVVVAKLLQSDDKFGYLFEIDGRTVSITGRETSWIQRL